PGTDDDPLGLPQLRRNDQIIPQPRTMDVVGLGPDGQPGTADDVKRFAPGEQGQAEFLLEGEKEGFHDLKFDIAAVLDGLATRPVNRKGQAQGGAVVRNPYFNMTFTVPNIARAGEPFPVYVTVTNIGKGAANKLHVAMDQTASQVGVTLAD